MGFYTETAPLKIVAFIVFCNNIFGSDQTVPLKVHEILRITNTFLGSIH